MTTKQIVAIIDAQGVEQAHSEVTPDIPLDLLMAAAAITCESWNRDHPEDGWEVKQFDDTAEA